MLKDVNSFLYLLAVVFDWMMVTRPGQTSPSAAEWLTGKSSSGGVRLAHEFGLIRTIEQVYLV